MKVDYTTRTLRQIEPYLERMTVTPERAKEWLELNENNRPINSGNLARLIEELRAGRYHFNGETIKFDVRGNLLDGQHRLEACVRTGCSFESVVVFDLPTEVRSTIDIGATRTGGNVLAIEGFTNADHLAAAASALVNYESQKVKFPTISKPALLQVVRRHPKLAESVTKFRALPPGLPRSHIYMLHYVAEHLLGDQRAADDIVNVFVKGVPSYDGDPLHLFREKMLRLRAEKVRPPASRLLFSLVACFNSYRKRRSLSFFKWTDEPTSITGLDHRKI